MIQSSENPPWRLSDERSFIENLLCSRFNFFLVYFSLIVVGAITTHDPTHFKIILVLGALISIPFAGTLFRSQAKLDILLEEILRDKNHPASFADKNCQGPSMRKWLGYWIPSMCVGALILAAILSLFGKIAPSAS